MCYAVVGARIRVFSDFDRALAWLEQLDARLIPHGPILPC